ncbi:MAG: bifunctional UDP-N-acetylmuramoyl-tripeptide:D-alanyl-D-alanine ligase/alanine racemase, partial [Bacteroidia bacterium]
AVKGPRNNGHQFIRSLYNSGIRAFLTEEDYNGNPLAELPGAAIIKTSGSIAALHKLALHLRNNYTGTVISITGSNGKTIVKEWLSDILGDFHPTLRSPRSYNSQTGVPLSLWRLDNRYSYAVIEAGMSMPGEIEKLEMIIRPGIGIITNIGEAHQENFKDIEEKVREKLRLFVNCETIVYCADHKIICEILENDPVLKNRRLFSWSSSADANADIHIVRVGNDRHKSCIEVVWGNEILRGSFPFTDRASLENVSTCIASVAALGLPLEGAVKAMASLEPVAMRMEKKEGINRCVLIEDYYNSDPGSLGMALDHLKDIPNKDKTLIISDFIQSGREMHELGGEIVLLASRAGVNRIICIGSGLSSVSELFPGKTEFFKDTAGFEEWFREGLFSDEAILLKGARVFRFEAISRLLERQVHTTRLEINLNAVLGNLNYFRDKLRKETKIMAMVKAFAYGAGSRDIAGWLNYNGIDFLTVAYIDEGIALRKGGVTNRIMVMSPDQASFRQMIEFDLEPELFSVQVLKAFVREADKNGLVDYPVHIKLETGMYRLGIEETDLDEVVLCVNSSSSIRLASVFSHLAASESSHHDHLTIKQAGLFEKMSSYLQVSTGQQFLRHLLNSTGIERFPQYQYDMVRLGIGLYYTGVSKRDKLYPATIFKTTVTQVKRVRAGEGVGYGFTEACEHDRVIAIVPVGYADGLMRMMGGGRIRMFLNGSFVPTVGRICMDMCMLDVTGTEVSPGDEAEIFGPNISVYEVAEACETIPHEILSGIHPRVRRVFFYD